MRIIQVVGTSGTGKTTFIRELITYLTPPARIAVVKHLGHHLFPLEQEKDTTLFFEAGIARSVGIDVEKSVILARDAGLDPVLRELCDTGVTVAIVEGFKSVLFPRIVFGDLPSPKVVLRNPSVAEVVQNLAQFPTMVTLQGLVQELDYLSGAGAKDVISTLRLPREGGADVEDTAALQREIALRPGVTGARAGVQELDGHRYLLLAVRAVDRASAIQAIEAGEGGRRP